MRHLSQLMVVAEQRPQSGLVCAALAFGVGAGCEKPEHAGALHLLEHALVQSLRDPCSEAPHEALLVNGRTTYFFLSVSVSGLPQEIDSVVSLVARIWLFRRLTDGETRREAGVILSEIASRAARVDHHCHWASAQLLGRRFGFPVEGCRDSLQRLSAVQVNHYLALLEPSSAVLALAGDLDTEDLDFAAHGRKGPTLAVASEGRCAGYDGDVCREVCPTLCRDRVRLTHAPESDSCVAVAIPCILHEDRPALDLLAHVVNTSGSTGHESAGRLADDRKSGLAIRVVNLGPFPAVMLVTGRGSDAGHVSLSVSDVRDRLLGAVDSVTDAMLMELRQRILLDWTIRQQAPEMRAATLCVSQLLSDRDFSDRYVAQITDSSRLRLEKVISDYLVGERLLLPGRHRGMRLGQSPPRNGGYAANRVACYRRIHEGKRRNSSQCTTHQLVPSDHGGEPDEPSKRKRMDSMAVCAFLFAREPSPDTAEREASGLAALAMESELLSRTLNRRLCLSSFTSKDSAGLVVSGSSQHVSRVVPRVLDLAAAPSLSRDAFAEAKARRVKYLRWLHEQQFLRSQAHMEECLFRGTSYEHPTYGTFEGLECIDYADMQRHLAGQACRSAVVLLVGHGQGTQLLRSVHSTGSSAAGGIPPVTARASEESRSDLGVASSCLVQDRGSGGILHCLGFAIPCFTDPAYADLCLLNLRLAGCPTRLSILRRNLRSGFHLYEVRSDITRYRGGNVLWIRWLIPSDRRVDPSAVLEVVRREAQSLTESLDDDTLHELKKLWERQYARATQGIVAQATTSAYHELNGLGLDFSERFSSWIAATSGLRVEETAERFLGPSPHTQMIRTER